MTRSINAAVGRGGSNQPTDVRTVQELLNQHRTVGRIVVDGVCGQRTIQAIEEFQSKLLSFPDGRVDPGGRTWRALVDGASAGSGGLALVQLPQICGTGYYSYSPGDRQYGTATTVQTLKDVCGTFRLNMPAVQIGIGDLSLAGGGPMPPHKSHQHGTSVDLRPIRTDGGRAPVSITDKGYSRERTKLLVESLVAHRNVKRVLFNDSEIKGVAPCVGHHNHLHVDFRS